MEKIKNYFGIDTSYQFDWGDLRALVTIVNVVLIMIYGLSIAWFGLAVALVGVVKDLTTDHKINGLLMHLANIVLNVYFLAQL